jgi:hypothetical protein
MSAVHHLTAFNQQVKVLGFTNHSKLRSQLHSTLITSQIRKILLQRKPLYGKLEDCEY